MGPFTFPLMVLMVGFVVLLILGAILMPKGKQAKKPLPSDYLEQDPPKKVHYLRSIHFDDQGWEDRGEIAADVWGWFSPEGDGVGLFLFDLPPDLPTETGFEEFRAASDALSGVPAVEMSFVLLAGWCPAVRKIMKVPQEPSGMTYLGSLTIPFRDFSYVLKVQCEERGPTGTREAILMDRLLGKGLVTIGDDGQIQGKWNPDDARHDAQFPEHPLSRARRVLAHLEATVTIDAPLKSAPKFPLPV